MIDQKRAEARRQARERFFAEHGGVDHFAEAQSMRAAATFPARDEPASHDTYGIEERCRGEWESSAAIRAEFRTFEVLLAYRKAEAKGLVRIFSRGRQA
jgi:hypothetical protein